MNKTTCLHCQNVTEILVEGDPVVEVEFDDITEIAKVCVSCGYGCQECGEWLGSCVGEGKINFGGNVREHKCSHWNKRNDPYGSFEFEGSGDLINGDAYKFSITVKAVCDCGEYFEQKVDVEVK